MQWGSICFPAPCFLSCNASVLLRFWGDVLRYVAAELLPMGEASLQKMLQMVHATPGKCIQYCLQWQLPASNIGAEGPGPEAKLLPIAEPYPPKLLQMVQASSQNCFQYCLQWKSLASKMARLLQMSQAISHAMEELGFQNGEHCFKCPKQFAMQSRQVCLLYHKLSPMLYHMLPLGYGEIGLFAKLSK